MRERDWEGQRGSRDVMRVLFIWGPSGTDINFSSEFLKVEPKISREKRFDWDFIVKNRREKLWREILSCVLSNRFWLYAKSYRTVSEWNKCFLEDLIFLTELCRIAIVFDFLEQQDHIKKAFSQGLLLIPCYLTHPHWRTWSSIVLVNFPFFED